jgi:hypothetical protein
VGRTCSPRDVQEEEDDCIGLTEDFIGRWSDIERLTLRRTAGGESSSLGAALRVQRESVEGGVGCGGGRLRSWVPFIGLGR